MKDMFTKLTNSQNEIFNYCKSSGSQTVYNNPFEFVFDKTVFDVLKLEIVIKNVIENYEAFNVKIVYKDSCPYMMTENCNGDINVVRAKESDYLEIKENFVEPFEIDGGKLFRFKLVETEKNIYLLFDIHKIVFDSTSINIFERALAGAYEKKPIEKETTTMSDVAVIEQVINEDGLVEHRKFFEKYIEDTEINSNLVSDLYDENNNMSTISTQIKIDSAEIEKCLKKMSIKSNFYFLGTFAYTLSKYNYQNSVLFTSIDRARSNGNYENSIGMFSKLFPIYINIDENDNASTFLNKVADSFDKSISHDTLSFGEIEKTLGIDGSIKFDYQKNAYKSFYVKGTKVFVNKLSAKQTNVNLSCIINDSDKGITLTINYKSSIYSNDLIKGFIKTYVKMLRKFLNDTKLCDILLIPQDHKNMIVEFNKTEQNYNENATIVSLFYKSLKECRDDKALVFKNREITYAELNNLSNKIANYIVKSGIGRDEFVSILLDRGDKMVIAALGVLKSGAGYEPLDPSYPNERLNFMVHDCKAKLLITSKTLRNNLNEYNGPVLYIEDLNSLEDKKDANVKIIPHSAALILYTSGTTGTPKGCIIEHAQFVAFNETFKTMSKMKKGSRTAYYASFGFDASLLDIYGTLCNGGTLYVIPEEIRLSLDDIEKFYIDNKITYGFITTQVGRMFIENTKCPTLKSFILGGEALTPVHPASGIDFYNAYGPTETTVFVCAHKVEGYEPHGPIGKANKNTKLYVVDKELRELPIGAIGELCISGKQVTRGYLNRPEKNAEAFIENPFEKERGYERLYRTGDVVRYKFNGNIDYIGRQDGQVKVRGFRIELTEVEAVIREYAGIKNATCVAYDENGGGKYVAAYITSDSKIDIRALNNFILERKPPYMVPKITMQIPEIPLNVNGKVDKRKLPAPTINEDEMGGAENVVEARDELEKEICKIVGEIIGIDKIGVNVDIFEMGLTSIGSIKLNHTLSEKYNVSLQIKDLFENNTVEKIAKYIKGIDKTESSNNTILKYYPITKSQEGVFVDSFKNAGKTIYNIPVIYELDTSIDVNKLKNAIVDVVACHPYIKTHLIMNDEGNIVEERRDDEAFTISDIEDIKVENLMTSLNSIIKPFELMDSRLFRFAIIYENDKKYLFLDMHHIIADGTTLGVVVEDLSDLYMGKKVMKETYTSFDYALSLTTDKMKIAKERGAEYYKNLLSGLSKDIISPFKPQVDNVVGKGEYYKWSEIINFVNLREWCDSEKISENGYFISAYFIALSKVLKDEKIHFFTVYHGRNDTRVMRNVGMYVYTYPIVSDNPIKIVDKSPKEYINDLSTEMIKSMGNDAYTEADISNDLGYKPDILFVYESDTFSFRELCGRPTKQLIVPGDTTKEPILMMVTIENNKVHLQCDYDKSLVSEELIKSVVDEYEIALANLYKVKTVSDVMNCIATKNETANEIISKNSAISMNNAVNPNISEITNTNEVENIDEKMEENMSENTTEKVNVNVNVNENKVAMTYNEYFNNLFAGIDNDNTIVSDAFVDMEKVIKKATTKIGANKLYDYCKKENINAKVVMLTAYAYLVSKYNYRNDCIISYNNSVPFVIKDVEKYDNSSLFRASKKQLIETIKMSTQVDNLNDYLTNEFDLNFQMVYSDTNMEFDEKENCMLFNATFVDGIMNIEITYDGSLYTETFINTFMRNYIKVMKAIINDKKLSEIDFNDDSSMAMYNKMNNTYVDIDLSSNIINEFKKMALMYPYKDAVVIKDKKITYGELDKATDIVAKYLMSRGIGKGKVVGVLINRNEYMFILSYAIIKTGAAYLPLDPTYPKERINFMLTDANASMLLYEDEFASVLDDSFNAEKITTSSIKRLIDENINSDVNVNLPTLSLDDLFIILYTSGSTGVPKGVLITHKNVYAMSKALVKEFNKNENTVSTSYASYGFDANTYEIYSTLIVGGTVHIISNDIRLDLLLVNDYYNKNGITEGFMTTQLGRQFVEDGTFTTLKTFSTGGEKLVPIDPPTFNFYNGYGPTECLVYVSAFKVDKKYKNVPLGVPLQNLKFYVVDKNGNIIPSGFVGELLVSGYQVSNGYLNREDKTKETFTKNNFCAEVGHEVLYHTGDVVRFNDEGLIQFIGRKDHQVKIRGFRIELSEVEEVIRKYNGITNATVQAYDDPSGGKYIVAYIVSNEKVDVSDLNEFIKKTKPPYMVPKFTMQLENIPLNQNGKVNKKMLPMPSAKTTHKDSIENNANANVNTNTTTTNNDSNISNDVEAKLVKIFAKILSVDEVSADDDFFTLGGTSISASRLALLCMKEGLQVFYKDIFDYSTPKKLAEQIIKNGGAVVPSATVSTESNAHSDNVVSEAAKVETNASLTKVNEEAANIPTNNNVNSSTNVNAIINNTNSLLIKTNDEYYDVLKNNVIDNVADIISNDIGNVVVAGATGFLGIHVVKELIDRGTDKIYCLVRSGKDVEASVRLKSLLAYYFDNSYKNLFDNKIVVIDTDITNSDLEEKLSSLDYNTIINCAAIVKHFSNDDSLDRVNVGGTKNLVEIAQKYKKRFIQVSTCSVAGESVNDNIPLDFSLTEDRLSFGQNQDNKYVHTKYMAEEVVLNAIREGLDAKIMRLGNLMSRASDGEFQVNKNTNSFMSQIRSYVKLGAFPISELDTKVEFSPIDQVAKAIVLLAGTNRDYTVFHPFNSHEVHMANIIEVLRKNGLVVDIVRDETFNKKFNKMIEDEKHSIEVSSLISYMSDSKEKRRQVAYTNNFTTKALYYLGFSWSLTSEKYIDNAIKQLISLRFFD